MDQRTCIYKHCPTVVPCEKSVPKRQEEHKSPQNQQYLKKEMTQKATKGGVSGYCNELDQKVW